MTCKAHNTMVILCSLGLLTIGSGIYIFFRHPIIAFSMLHIHQYEMANEHIVIVPFYFLLYCLPDALWYMSLLLVQILFLEEKGWLNRLLVGTAISLPFLLEIGQYLGIVSGTFDWYDILTYCLTLILFLCLRKISLLSHSK